MCIKVDTEGHEYQVLLGLFDGLSADLFPKLVMFEFNTRPTNRTVLESCLSLLKQHGYQEVKYIVRYGNLLLFESDWKTQNFDISRS